MYAGVVGLGIGNQHALAILESPHCTLSHLCDFDTSKINQFKQEHNRSDIISCSFEDLLKEQRINLICIASFDDHHYSQVLDALNAKKHVFVEKPLCQTWDQLITIYEAFTKSKCGLLSNLVLRTSELFQYIGNLIADGELGEIYYFEGDYLYGRLHKMLDGWRKEVDNYSVMEGGGIHMIDLMVNLTGQKPSHVTSTSNKIATKNTSFRYHDFHSSIFRFGSGLIGKITANFGCVHPHQHIIKVYGTKGTFIYDDQGARLYRGRLENEKPEQLTQKAKPTQKGLLIHKFVRMIHSNELIGAAQREFDLMSMVIAAENSLHTNQELEIGYLQC